MNNQISRTAQLHTVLGFKAVPSNTKQIKVSSYQAAKTILSLQAYSEGWYWHQNSLHHWLFVKKNEWENVHKTKVP